MDLKEGDTAPQFSLPDQWGTIHNLSDYRGKYVLIYFYPKDSTPGCTKEACAFKESYKKFKSDEIVILGISIDSVKRHENFSKKFSLPFPILSDEEKRVVSLFQVWGKKKFMGKEYYGTHRYSFLIDGGGKIIKVYTKVKPDLHPEEVLTDLATIKAQP